MERVRYNVRIDGEVAPRSFTYEELLINDFLELDDIEIQKVGTKSWTIVTAYYFPEEHGDENYFVDENGQVHFINSPSQVIDDHSGKTNNNDIIPVEIKKWNWGAFIFTWIWGIGNRLYWTLLILLLGSIPKVGLILVFVARIIFGIKGSEWAWKAKTWDSVEHFLRVQHNWAIACLWVLGISFVFAIIYVIITFNL